MFQEYINKILIEKLNVFIIVYLDNIFFNTKNKWETDVITIWWVPDQLQKYLLYANLKKCWFHEKKLRFLNYIISHNDVQIEE